MRTLNGAELECVAGGASSSDMLMLSAASAQFAMFAGVASQAIQGAGEGMKRPAR